MSESGKKRVKVVRIIARLNIGGPAIHTILLSEGLDRGEFESLLVTGKADECEGQMFAFAKDKSVCPIVIPQLRRKINFINDLIALGKIFFIILKEKPDIIHTHTAKAGALGRVAGLAYNIFSGRNKCKLIHTFHGTVLQGYFGEYLTRFFIWIERCLALFTDKIIVVSETVKKELLDFKIGNADKVGVIPLGLELQKLLTITIRKDNSHLRIGIIGRLAPIKNHKMFLEAARLFISGVTTCRFYIIGDGELRQDLEGLAKNLGIDKSVEFCGWESDVGKIYNNLDIVVLTSLNEGTPLSLIEAMAAARPVIAASVGGVADLFIKRLDYGLPYSDRIKVCDNGILCRSNDPASLTEALTLLTKESKIREKMGQEGRNFVKDRFSKERLIKDMQMLYNNLSKGLPAGRQACRTGRQGVNL